MAGRKTFRTKAIVLDSIKLSEQDLILTTLSAQGSQLRLVAKGARKPGGRLAARCELFCEDDLLVAHTRSSLSIISEALTSEAHAGLRGDLMRVSAASAVCEIARLTCYEDADDPYLYPICSRALKACEQATDSSHLQLVVAAYTFKVLAHSGWRPELAYCVACGDAAVEWFSPTAGGMLCSSCARQVAAAQQLSNSEIAWLKALLSKTFDILLDSEIDALSASVLLTLARRWATTQLDVRLKAFEFLLSL
jgi:DNA repair protein RecO (recombination protein O)